MREPHRRLRMQALVATYGKVSAHLAARQGLRFALIFGLLAGALFTLYGFPFELFGARGDWLHNYLVAYAHLAGGVLSVFERGLTVDGTFIHGRFPLQIVRNCDAADVNILFTAALLAFPGPLHKKAPRLLIGLTLLVAANVTRICALYYVGVWAPSWFKVAHEEVWPLLLVAATLAIFLGAVRGLSPVERPGAA